MSSFAKLTVLSLLLLLSSAVAVPHTLRTTVHHRALAARVPVPVAAPMAGAAAPRRRSLNKRCKPRVNASSVAAPSGAASTSTLLIPTSLPPVANAAPSPVQSFSEVVSHAPVTTHKAATTTHQPAETHQESSTHKAAPTPTPEPVSSGGGNEPSYLLGTQTGQGTFYGTGLGACGITNKDSDLIAAVSHLLYDTFPGYTGGNPNNNPLCGKQVKATYQGKSVTVAITDRCTGCALTDLDFSPTAFKTIADPAIGRISGMNWEWLS